MLARLPGKARRLKLRCGTSAGIPLLGRIAAGHPEAALQDSDEVGPGAPQFFRGADLFALRVKGDSMKDAGILSGDIAVVNCQQDVADGDIAAVLLDDDATLEFFHRRRGSVVLRGANPAFPDIIVRSDEPRSLRILGKYVVLIRQQGGAACCLPQLPTLRPPACKPALGGGRTHNLCLRRAALYPVELRVRERRKVGWEAARAKGKVAGGRAPLTEPRFSTAAPRHRWSCAGRRRRRSAADHPRR